MSYSVGGILTGPIDNPTAGETRLTAKRDAAAPGHEDARSQSLQGLSAQEVAERRAAGQVNAAPSPSGRSTWNIVRSNVFTWFNLILGVLFVLMMTLGSLRDALFGVVIVVNAVIGIVQEIRAKRTLDHLSVITAPAAHVIRAGKEQDVRVADVVLGDVVRLSAGDQVIADGEVLRSAGLEADESLLTGESVPVTKQPGDKLLSGSFAAAGAGVYRTVAVGREAYAQRLTQESRRYARTRSELTAGVNAILRVVGVLIVPIGAFFVWSQFSHGYSLTDGVTHTVAALVAMVPQGLVLLVSIAFAVSAVRLAQRKVLTQELPAVEGLARTDVLCMDKTGTITEPDPAFERLEPIPEQMTTAGGDARQDGAHATTAHATAARAEAHADAWTAEIQMVLAGLVAASPSRNSTLAAIAAAMPAPEAAGGTTSAGWEVRDSVAFSSARKWSAAEFVERGTWVMGAPEMLLPDDGAYVESRKRVRQLAEQGYRVLLLARSASHLEGEVLPSGLAPSALVLLREKVRNDAPDTVRFFNEQGVILKVISGDSPVTVQTIAERATVPGSDAPPVDGRSLPPEEDRLADVMEHSAVFGRVTPDQKRSMVAALQSRGHTVAMTGDGVNDVLALKKADLGIAIGSGAAAARAVAQLVLLDGRFAQLPRVVAEGRRVTANIERVANIFATKTVWATILAIVVASMGLPYPLLPRQLTLVDAVCIGIPSFFLALAPNPRRYLAGFVRRVATFVLPAGILAGVAAAGTYVLLRHLGTSVEASRTLETALLTVIGLRVISVLERPVRGWRLGLLVAMIVILGLAFIVPYAREFFALVMPGWTAIGVTAAIAVVICVAIGFVPRVSRIARERIEQKRRPAAK